MNDFYMPLKNIPVCRSDSCMKPNVLLEIDFFSCDPEMNPAVSQMDSEMRKKVLNIA